MEMNINKSFIQKVFILFLCVYLALMPAFCYKRANAAFEKTRAYLTIATEIIMALRGVGFISDTTLTPENLENIYNKADAYLHENFGTELEYAEALRQVDQLGLDIASGQIFVPGNYSGKLWYSFLNAVVDVVWPYKMTDAQENQLLSGGVYFLGCVGNTAISYTTQNYKGKPIFNFAKNYGSNVLFNMGNVKNAPAKLTFYNLNIQTGRWQNSYGGGDSSRVIWQSYETGYLYNVGDYVLNVPKDGPIAKILLGSSNHSNVPNISKKTANKVKLPTRLPQSVINNINNYIDNSTENLIIAPNADELPTLPDNYNPNTDDPPDLPGYEDVTPDQPGTTDPEPTPSPTPEPTPTPPEYDGSSWIKPIGDFFAGLLSFLKDALIPTQTVDFSPLQNMGADVSGKFPFSLPGDIGKLFGVLNAEPIRPHFEMDFDLSKVGIPGEPIHWDLNVEQWDNGAAVVKTALYIAFLIGLVFITKQFMQN